jgi:hypothetical protein
MRAHSASVENDLGNGRHIATSISSPGDISSSYEADFSLYISIYFLFLLHDLRQAQID